MTLPRESLHRPRTPGRDQGGVSPGFMLVAGVRGGAAFGGQGTTQAVPAEGRHSSCSQITRAYAWTATAAFCESALDRIEAGMPSFPWPGLRMSMPPLKQ